MTDPLDLSVLIPARNEVENLPSLLMEIRIALAAEDHEVLVVDDGSSDRTLSVLLQLKSQGYTDLQPVADLAARNQQLMTLSQELYSKIQQESGHTTARLTQQSREQSLLMQTIAMDYASRSASVGATFMGGGESRPIEELVGEFASKLASLEQASQNTPQIKRTLGGVSTKWRYIEKSLLNYNENGVPFLVNKYSDSIIEGLEQVSAQYSATQL